MSPGKASIVIRTKNEERWIKSCLEGVVEQTYGDWEVILVDNESTDKTIEKAHQFDLSEVVTCANYKPGKALNLGIQASVGDYIVCLSGHCIPRDKFWLENLVSNFENPEVAGAYGRQEPLSFTPDRDKRDLHLIFGKDQIVQTEGDFFHNANSAIRSEVWEQYPFDEEVDTLEDRIWARRVLEAGYKLIYDPTASVYHYHGIFHDGDKYRQRKHIQVLENLTAGDFNRNIWNPDQLEITAIIPSIGPPEYVGDSALIRWTIKHCQDSELINRIVVSTDNEETATRAIELGASVPFLRDSSLSEDYVSIEQVLNYTLHQLEERDVYPDVLVLAEPTFPFRPANLFDNMIQRYFDQGLDTIIAGRLENKPIFTKSDDEKIEMVLEGITPRKFQKARYAGIRGLGAVISPDNIRRENIYSDEIGIYLIDSPLSVLELRQIHEYNNLSYDDSSVEILSNFIEYSGAL
jgi:GT2 family glycosyltransferase